MCDQPFSDLQQAYKNLQLENEQLKDQLTMVSRMQSQYHAIFESISDLVFLQPLRDDQRHSHFIEVNNLVIEELGYTREELQCLSFSDLIVGGQGKRPITHKVLNQSENKMIEEKLLKKNGDHLEVEMRISIVTMNGLMHVLTIARNVTSKKIEELRLRESEEQFRRLFHESLTPLCYVEADNRITILNRKFTEVFGYTLEDIPDSETWYLKAYPDSDYRQWVVDTWNNYVEEAAKANNEIKPEVYKVICKNGEIKLVNISGILIGERFMVALKDVTTEVNLEAEKNRLIAEMESKIHNRTLALRVAKEQADQASKTKSAFLANMSHEIRTPMNAIIGMSQMLDKTNITPEQKRYVEVILTASENLLGIINNVLDLSKIEADKIEIEYLPIEMPLIVDKIKLMMGEVLKKKLTGLEFRTHVHYGVPKVILGDEVHLMQIITNLTMNAIKFTNKGLVELYIRMEDLDGQLYLVIEVRDTGIGIAKEDQNRLFESFEQADTSITRKFGGSGLGLAICKKLVDKMNGSIQLESELGIGSVFKVALPMIDDVEQINRDDGLKQLVDRSFMDNKHILVVDDNELNQEVIYEILSSEGVYVILVSNGLEAVDVMTEARDRFDVILMDIHMPVMDGYEATRRIRQLDGCQHIPIIAMTADAMSSTKMEIYNNGFTDYVTKPVIYDRLIEVIGQALRNEGAEHL